MLCRVADAIYWMARYMERAENVARFIDVNLNLTLDAPEGFVAAKHWMALVTTSGDDQAFLASYGHANQDNVIRFLAFDQDNPNSILSCLRATRENARSVREVLSSEMWEHINEVYLRVQAIGRESRLLEEASFFKDVKLASHLFIGLSEATMSHGEAWHFARLGRLLERADKTGRILDARYFMLRSQPDHIDTPQDALLLGALLKSASAFEMYRKQFQRLHRMDVAKFLLFDRQFPRALAYCVEQAQYSMDRILDADHSDNQAAEELRLLSALIANGVIDQVIATSVHDYIDRFQQQLNRLDDAIRSCFFELTHPSIPAPIVHEQIQS